MEIFDVAIVGGGPAGSSCAAFCALAGLRTLVLERERFPREKVCGDCLNPSCWPVLERLGLTKRVWDLQHSKLTSVEFVAIDGHKVIVPLPSGDDCELSIKRSLFDELLLRRARELGAQVRGETTVTAVAHEEAWKIVTASGETFRARILIGADGRNSTVARLRNLLPRPARKRVALQAHIPLPLNFGARIVLQFLQEGYSGQAPVNETELNLCLVGRPSTISRLRQWAQRQFEIPTDQPWRTITPLTRRACSLRSRKSSFYRRRCPRRGAVYWRRNLLRASLRRARFGCDCENHQRQGSTIGTPRIRSCLCRNVLGKTLDQSTCARCGFISSHRFALFPRSAN